jgi:hypothetical protein
MGTWRSSMLASFLAALGRPDWWSMALAGFLVRGGIVLVLLPIVTVPTPAQLATAFSPAVSQLAFGGLTPVVLLGIVAGSIVVLAVVAAGGLAGAWLDREQLSSAAIDDELGVDWTPLPTSLREALSVRLAAHLPTLAALAYATFRLVGATYDELTSPGDIAVPIVLRVVGRAPETVLFLVAGWLVGEAVGGLAVRHLAAGATFGASLRRGARQLLTRRALATFGLMSVELVAVVAPFLLAVSRAWQQLRDILLVPSVDPLLVGAALLVLVASWILGLAVIGAALAWRATAWTAELRPAGKPRPDAAFLHPGPSEA